MYEELVKNLRICSRCDFGQGCNGCTQKSDDSFCCDRLLHKAADAIGELSAKVESLQIFADNISKLPDCNTCMKKHTCEFVPRYGEYCRINCPAELFKVIDSDHVYSNGIEFVPIFRMQQWFDHLKERPKTEGDRIRAMSDEELAEFMCHNVSSGTVNCAFCAAEEFCRMGHNGWLDWLKKEAENNNEV